jgi:cation-transporting ATPase 13A3/4/5
MLFPKPSDFEFYYDSFKFIGILAFMSVVGTCIDLVPWLEAYFGYSGEKINDIWWVITIKASQIITITVPPALPTCMQIGISVALSRLQVKQTYCISPQKINEAGRINCMCFDKTGTLTEEGLDILGVRPVFVDRNTQKLSFAKMINIKDFEKLAPKIDDEKRDNELKLHAKVQKSGSLYESTRQLPSEQFLEAMATCHSLTIVNGTTIGDPLDVKMYESTQWLFDEKETQVDDTLVAAILTPPKKDSGTPSIGIVRRFEFVPKLQRMSCIVKEFGLHGYRMHIKGSPEKVREMCRPDTIPSNFHDVLQKYTENGYRVLAMGTRKLDIPFRAIMTSNREDIELDFSFIGFLIVENRLKPITTSIIDELHRAEIRTIMVTGDNVLTAISVARQCHIVDGSQKI